MLSGRMRLNMMHVLAPIYPKIENHVQGEDTMKGFMQTIVLLLLVVRIAGAVYGSPKD